MLIAKLITEECTVKQDTAGAVTLLVEESTTTKSVSIVGEDVDRLAACMLDGHAVDTEPSLRCLRNIIYSAGFAMTVQRRDTERANSVSIQHHDHFLHSRYKYRRRGLMLDS
ncbi:hypothetical protein SK128_016363 [Halocaridina rubra]|uniref:Uncharacterized protein n=1 Tax=Halocaridina rubra TaxID=373956 RepID=A0AAN9A633_HALRR